MTPRANEAADGQTENHRRRALAGEVTVAGAKNAALPILAATLLTAR
jgi:UDP-N-acetylglucosamine enolpyruvyl transferase